MKNEKNQNRKKHFFLIELKHAQKEMFFSIFIFLLTLSLNANFSYALPQNFVVTPQYTLRTGESRNYVITLSDRALQVSSVKDASHLNDATFISDIPLDFEPTHISLEPISSEESQDEVNEEQTLTLITDTGEVKTLLLRDVLAQAFKNRDKRIEEEHAQRKEEHQRALQDYEESSDYTLAQIYNMADGFFKGFIPFDDDLAPQAINHAIFHTTPQKMVLEDLKSRNLLGEFSSEDAQRFKSFSHIHDIAYAVGLTAIVALPVAIKGRQMVRAHQATKAARQATPFTTIQSPQALIAHTIKTHFDPDKLKRSLVFMGVTNVAWIAGDLVVTPLVKKEWNGWGQVAYNGGFINTLTGAILLIVSSKTSFPKKAILMVVITDIVSPPFQRLQSMINQKPYAYDPIQTAWDKLYLTLYCIPKNMIAINLQKNWERQLMTGRGLTAGQAAARAQPPIAIANEIAGNVPYTVLVQSGREFLREHLTPMMEENQFDLEKFLNETEIEKVILFEPAPEEIS